MIAFLTQDATPAPGWLAAIREGFAISDDVGAVYGPHRPRADTSPMIARELTEFFATFAPHDGPPREFGPGDPTFLSNVNAAYRRACWEQIRFDDIAYSEDQAFGRALAAHERWRKVYHPQAAVLHAHDYPPAAIGEVDHGRQEPIGGTGLGQPRVAGPLRVRPRTHARQLRFQR